MNKIRLLPIVEETLTKYGLVYDVLGCPPELADTSAFCEHYHLPLHQAANTILVVSRKVDPPRYAVCVILGTNRLDVNKKVCELLAVRKASFADAETTVQLTGMLLGGVVAIGIHHLPIFVDSAVLQQKEVVMGGGNRSSKVVIKPQEMLKLPNVTIIEGLANPIRLSKV